MRCLAGGQFSVVAGEWLDGIRSPVCQVCPSLDPSVAICEGKTVKSQPGYFSHYSSTTGSRRTDNNAAIAVTKCPNQQACKHVGLIDSVCGRSVAMCNDNTSTKCDTGYTGIPLHATSHQELITWVPGLLCAECDSGWFSGKLVRSPSIMCVVTMCVHRALSSAKLVRMQLYW